MIYVKCTSVEKFYVCTETEMPNNMDTGDEQEVLQKNEVWFPGGKWCTNHGWCAHTTRGCQGVARKHVVGTGRGNMICYHCKSTTHFIKDCPTRPKRGFGCWNCGGQHPIQECEAEFDADLIFANKKASKEKWATSTSKGKGEEGEATASIHYISIYQYPYMTGPSYPTYGRPLPGPYVYRHHSAHNCTGCRRHHQIRQRWYDVRVFLRP